MIKRSWYSKKAFIPIKLFEFQHFEHIESLHFQHPNVLALNDITESVISSDTLDFLVVEDVNTIKWFLSGMFQNIL